MLTYLVAAYQVCTCITVQTSKVHTSPERAGTICLAWCPLPAQPRLPGFGLGPFPDGGAHFSVTGGHRLLKQVQLSEPTWEPGASESIKVFYVEKNGWSSIIKLALERAATEVEEPCANPAPCKVLQSRLLPPRREQIGARAAPEQRPLQPQMPGTTGKWQKGRLFSKHIVKTSSFPVVPKAFRLTDAIPGFTVL